MYNNGVQLYHIQMASALDTSAMATHKHVDRLSLFGTLVVLAKHLRKALSRPMESLTDEQPSLDTSCHPHPQPYASTGMVSWKKKLCQPFPK